MERELDRQVLNGDGENLRGILNVAGVPSQALGADTRTQALVRASLAVHQAEFAGPLSAVVHPSDFHEILFGLLGAGADLPILGEAGLERFVPSTLIPAGTILLGDFAAAAVLYVRDGLTLTIGDQHASYWAEGKVALIASGRVYLEVPRQADRRVNETWGADGLGTVCRVEVRSSLGPAPIPSH